MASMDLNGLSCHINTKISIIKKSLQLRKMGKMDPSLKTVLGKIAHEMYLLNDLLNQLELECHRQEGQQNQLKVANNRNGGPPFHPHIYLTPIMAKMATLGGSHKNS
uniref:Uncharacterized protein n=1 Tax=Varanus komodoensis TaxID=61221 RepID=A0A8D2L4U0_VARKO